MSNLAVLAQRLSALDLFAGRGPIAVDELVVLDAYGVAHTHFVIGDTGALLRLPRAASMGALDVQRAAFARAAASGHAPRLLGMLEPGSGAEHGALVVEYIDGRVPTMADLPAIGRALAKLHMLPTPEREARPPIPDQQQQPWAATLAAAERLAGGIDRAHLPEATLAALDRAFDAARTLAATLPLPKFERLIATDCHPGNFVIEHGTGRAVLVDLERAQYGFPGLDLAHAVLPGSTRWDPRIAAVAGSGDVAAFLASYADVCGPPMFAALDPWLDACWRLVGLRTASWMAAFRSRIDARQAGPDALAPGLARHFIDAADKAVDPAALDALFPPRKEAATNGL